MQTILLIEPYGKGPAKLEYIPERDLYVDNHLLVTVKPAGIATQPDFAAQMQIWVKEHFHKPGNAFLTPIHRLDQPVEGLLLFARTSKALGRLQKLMRERQIKKIYVAWVEGEVKENEGELVHFLSHGAHRALIDPAGKEARLSFKVIKREKKRTCVSIQLETGRYHQIRAQFSALGHPICGDGKYGSLTPKPTISLWATGLEFLHPVTKDPLKFQFQSSAF